MHPSLTATALVGTLALAGCPSAPQQPSTAVSAAVCGLSQTEGNTCMVRGNRRFCHIFAGALADGRPYVFPHTLNVPRGSAGNRQTTIVWHLLDPRFVFTPADGPLELKTNNPEFEQGGPTESPEGDPENVATARRYRITFKNEAQSTHNYRIAFRQGGNLITCDPRITNAGD